MKKYIYRVYASKDKVIHCEKNTIIYKNENYIYLKCGRKQQLDVIYLNTFYSKQPLNSVNDIECENILYLNEYLYEKPTDEELQNLREIIKNNKKEKEINDIKNEINKTEEKLQSLKDKLLKLES